MIGRYNIRLFDLPWSAWVRSSWESRGGSVAIAKRRAHARRRAVLMRACLPFVDPHHPDRPAYVEFMGACWRQAQGGPRPKRPACIALVGDTRNIPDSRFLAALRSAYWEAWTPWVSKHDVPTMTRERRGKEVVVPTAWVGQIPTRQTIRNRRSRLTGKQRRLLKQWNGKRSDRE